MSNDCNANIFYHQEFKFYTKNKYLLQIDLGYIVEADSCP